MDDYKGTTDNPSYYLNSIFGKEAIDVNDRIRDIYNETNVDMFYLGNVIKYLLRAPLKENLVLDLKKMEWYLNKLNRVLNESKEDE